MPSRFTLPRNKVAHAAGMDLANRRMQAAGRAAWNMEDYRAAVAEYHRIDPCPPDMACEFCHPAAAPLAEQATEDSQSPPAP